LLSPVRWLTRQGALPHILALIHETSALPKHQRKATKKRLPTPSVGVPRHQRNRTDNQPFSEKASGGELVIGMVAPLGADLERVERELESALREAGYAVERITLTELLAGFGVEPEMQARLDSANVVTRYEAKMDLGTTFCRETGLKDALAHLAIDEIRRRRLEKRPPIKSGDFVAPLKRTAFLIHQLKRPDEITRLRSVYDERFRLLGVWEPKDQRVDGLTRKLALQAQTRDLDQFHDAAKRIVDRDEKELPSPSSQTGFGQNVRDTFPLADFFVSQSAPSDDGRPPDLAGQLRRFVHAVFGDPQITPTRNELGMYLAVAAALRSGSLARQVGAALCTSEGSVISIGTNEVPKPGGQYWVGDLNDDRDIVRGNDASDIQRLAMIGEVLERLQKAGWLNENFADLTVDQLVSKALDRKANVLRASALMDILEFIRAMHAEQAAISDAAQRGVPTVDSVLYVTTFPCHECARAILGAGIRKVLYIEPYPKSRALEQFPKGITTDPGDGTSRVPFIPFIGIAPRFFRQVFQWSETRKAENGELIEWNAASAFPRSASEYPGYIIAELLDSQAFLDLLPAKYANRSSEGPDKQSPKPKKRVARKQKL
jgi:deoxycytidylate deaminase